MTTGTFTPTEAPDRARFSGRAADPGTLHATESPDIFRAKVFQPRLVALAATENVDTFSGAGYIPGRNIGPFVTTEAPDICRVLGAGSHPKPTKRRVNVS